MAANNTLAEALRRATEAYTQSSDDYRRRILAGGGLPDALTRAANEADPSLTQLRTAKADVSKKLGTVFTDSMDSMKDVTDPRIREQMRARQSSEFGTEAEKLGGMVSDVGASRDATVSKLASIFGAGTSAAQFDTEQRKAALDRATSDVKDEQTRQRQLEDTEMTRTFESRMDDLTRREKEASIAATNRSNRGSGGGSGSSSPTGTAQDYATLIASGQMTLTNVPMKDRAAVAQYINDNGIDLLPQKARDSLAAINAGKVVASKIKELSAGMNSSTAGVSLLSGLIKSGYGKAGQANQAAVMGDLSKSLVSTLSRALGEKGVLTDQDVKRAQALIPTPYDSKGRARQKIDLLDSFFNELTNRAKQTYTGTADSIGGGTVDTGV